MVILIEDGLDFMENCRYFTEMVESAYDIIVDSPVAPEDLDEVVVILDELIPLLVLVRTEAADRLE